MSTDFTRLIDSTRARLPGALDGTIKLELFSVLKEFTQRSNAWREDIGFSTLPGVVEYDLLSENLAAINRLLYVASADAPTASIPATMATPGRLRLKYTPSGSEALTATVALTVTDPTEAGGVPQFPQELLDKHFLGILDGLLSRMMSQPAKPYSSDRGAAMHGYRFRQATDLAKQEAQTGNVFGAQAWRFPGTMR
jgi:hypothetical protein